MSTGWFPTTAPEYVWMAELVSPLNVPLLIWRMSKTLW